MAHYHFEPTTIPETGAIINEYVFKSNTDPSKRVILVTDDVLHTPSRDGYTFVYEHFAFPTRAHQFISAGCPKGGMWFDAPSMPTLEV